MIAAVSSRDLSECATDEVGISVRPCNNTTRLYDSHVGYTNLLSVVPTYGISMLKFLMLPTLQTFAVPLRYLQGLRVDQSRVTGKS